MKFEATMFVERAAPPIVIRGDHWRVSWFDRELNQFIGGTGRSPWQALAWALVDREETKLKLVVMARSHRDTPESRIAVLRSGSLKPSVSYKLAAPSIVPPTKSAAARRAQSKKKAKAK